MADGRLANALRCGVDPVHHEPAHEASPSATPKLSIPKRSTCRTAPSLLRSQSRLKGPGMTLTATGRAEQTGSKTRM
jgi:hypothetical protein